MSSTTLERRAPSISPGLLSKATELKQRLWFTLFALVVYRIGTHIPLPGVNAGMWADFFGERMGGIFDMVNMFSGGSLERMSIFVLSVFPYISASIVMQFAVRLHPRLEALRKEGESGQKKINQYTRYLTIGFAVVQAYLAAVGLEQQGAAYNPGMFFRMSAVITLVGATMFLVWLGDQITQRGVGNGVSLIIFAGIVVGVPGAAVRTFELVREDSITVLGLLGLVALIVAAIVFIVFIESAERRVMIQNSRKMSTNRGIGANVSHMPMKVNTGGVMPAILASMLLMFPMTLVALMSASIDSSSVWFQISRVMQPGRVEYMALYASLIVFFTLFYTGLQFDAPEKAERLKKEGSFIPGIRPGVATANYLDFIMTRITVIAAAYMVGVCLMPEVMTSRAGLPFYFGGTGLLIAISVPMNTIEHIQSHLYAQQYESLIKKARLRSTRK